MKYYKVIVPHGHYGINRYREITFYFYAKDAIHASKLAQRMPGVKHSRMVFSCIPITKEEYLVGRKQSAYHREGFQY